MGAAIQRLPARVQRVAIDEKIAASAETLEASVAPHNFFGHLCTTMNARSRAAATELRIMETDIDRLAWDQELFTHLHEFEDDYLMMPDRPG